MAKKVDRHRVAGIVADALGISIFVCAHIAWFAGRATEIFSFIDSPDPGLKFYLEVICAPVDYVFGASLISNEQAITKLAMIEVTFALTAIIYAAICYMVVRGILAFFLLGNK